MGLLSDIAGNAVKAYNSEDGAATRTDLQTFLGKFSSSANRYVETIDPLGTFDVQFKFYPSLTLKELKDQKKPSKWSRVGSSIGNSLVSAGKNALDNVTGGIFSSVMEGGDEESILKMREKFEYWETHTFLEYLAKANLLQVGEQWQSDQTAPLVLNLGPYVQSIDIPNLKIQTGKTGNSNMGEFPIITQPGVYPDGALNMTVLNTRAALHERIFYPWMREVSLPYWAYESQPYTTATITVDFSKHNDAQYVFVGCRPEQVNTMQATQAPDAGNITRPVSFLYDAMFVTSRLEKIESAKSKALGFAGGLLGGAGKMLNI